MILEKQSCWSIIKIDTKNSILDESIINKIYLTLDDFENKYSRFIKWNFLYNLNEFWKSSIDNEFKAIFKVCDFLNKTSNWYFDITVLPFLENFWYWIEDKKIKENFWMQNIEIIWDEIFLKNDVKIDFWAIWKGYLVDRIYDILSKEIDFFTIDFGWDTKVGKQLEIVWLEDPFDSKKIIWEIQVKEESICSSSSQKRQFWEHNHLVNTVSKDTKSDKLAIYTKHKLATLADAYSTALFVCPLELSIKLIEQNKNLEAMIILKNWEIFKSDWFDVKLY